MALSLLVGCAAEPLRAPDIAMPARFAGVVPAVRPSHALDRWWTLFGDAQLEALVGDALANAPDARAALAVLDEARATRTQALSRYDPQGNISGSIARQHSSSSGAALTGGAAPDTGQSIGLSSGVATTLYSGAFSPSWEIDLFGRRAAARGAADADLAAAGFRRDAALQSLTTNVAGNLFEARGLAVRLVEARETRRVAQDLADIGHRRILAGIGSRADAASLDADLAATQDVVRMLDAQLAVSRRTLLVLVGKGVAALDAIPIEPTLGEPPPIPETAPASLLIARPDVREAEARLRSAAGTLRLDELALLPTFSLAPSLSRNGVAGPSGYMTTLWSLGAGVVLPILDRHRLIAEIRGQRARGEQAVIAYEKAVQTAFGEAESAFVAYAADRDRVVILRRAEQASRYAFDAQSAGYRAGVVDLTTLLNAERTWRTNLHSLSTLRATTLRDAVNLFRALGGGWAPAAATSSNYPSGVSE